MLYYYKRVHFVRYFSTPNLHWHKLLTLLLTETTFSLFSCIKKTPLALLLTDTITEWSVATATSFTASPHGNLTGSGWRRVSLLPEPNLPDIFHHAMFFFIMFRSFLISWSLIFLLVIQEVSTSLHNEDTIEGLP